MTGYVVGSSYCKQEFKHGGVLLTIRNSIQSHRIVAIENKSKDKVGEFCGIMPAHDTLVMGVYRSPGGSFSEFMETLEDVLETACGLVPSHGNLYVASDFNIDLLCANSQTREMMCTFCSYGLTQQFFEHSRVSLR